MYLATTGWSACSVTLHSNGTKILLLPKSTSLFDGRIRAAAYGWASVPEQRVYDDGTKLPLLPFSILLPPMANSQVVGGRNVETEDVS